jgi:hypothetical protein
VLSCTQTCCFSQLQREGDIVATATYTLSCRSQTLIELPPEIGAVQMVMVTSSGGTPGPFQSIPQDEVRHMLCACEMHVQAIDMLDDMARFEGH